MYAWSELDHVLVNVPRRLTGIDIYAARHDASDVTCKCPGESQTASRRAGDNTRQI